MEAHLIILMVLDGNWS